MAFLDKVQKVAKNVGEKAGDAVEITKIEAKLFSEKKAMNEALQKIGAIYYEKYAAGEEIDEKAAEFFEAVKAAKANIERYEADKEKVKTE